VVFFLICNYTSLKKYVYFVSSNGTRETLLTKKKSVVTDTQIRNVASLCIASSHGYSQTNVSDDARFAPESTSALSSSITERG
jgi:hypothetical protein